MSRYDFLKKVGLNIPEDYEYAPNNDFFRLLSFYFYLIALGFDLDILEENKLKAMSEYNDAYTDCNSSIKEGETKQSA